VEKVSLDGYQVIQSLLQHSKNHENDKNEIEDACRECWVKFKGVEYTPKVDWVDKKK
jgi:hypothetical protein